MKPAIEIENLSKLYRLGAIGPGSLREALEHWFGKKTASPNGGNKAAGAKEFWALRDISFAVEPGEVLGLVGRNGAGKSTLLRILSKISEPTSGRAVMRGRVASLLEVGTGFHPELTGRENIFLNGAILGMKRAEITREFDAIVDFSGVGAFLDTPVKRYSSGMYVRLAFAVAAHLQPEILLLDEVLAVGDAAFQKKCLGKMRSVATNDGRTVVFVAHNMGAIKSLCRTAVWLDQGRIVASGPSGEIVDRYLEATMGNSAATIDLSDRPRTLTEGGGFRLEKVELNRGQAVKHGETLEVKIGFSSPVAVQDASIGCGFATLEGTRLLSLDSDLQQVRRDLPAGSRGYVTATIETFHLQPGRYGLDVGARSGDNSPLDYVAGCAAVEILPGPSTPGMLVRDTGGVRLPATWRWEIDEAS
ncbi:MAG TPA: ABC transporter ATP-binding protein [Chthoniobacteraceae bacterium]|jgi:lipopolysaccharide transport system ATP-binding protein